LETDWHSYYYIRQCLIYSHIITEKHAVIKPME
jgi:hypothetical protein